MPKTYTKAELFSKSMTLAKIQKIAEATGTEYASGASKEKIANQVLNKQHREALEAQHSAGAQAGGENETPTDVANKALAEIGQQNQKAASSENPTVDAVSAGSDTEAGSQSTEAPVRGDIPLNQFPHGFIDAVRKELGYDDLVAELHDLRENAESRLRHVEDVTDTLLKAHQKASTLHGSIDSLPKTENLPPPGRIDDLPKIGG